MKEFGEADRLIARAIETLGGIWEETSGEARQLLERAVKTLEKAGRLIEAAEKAHAAAVRRYRDW